MGRLLEVRGSTPGHLWSRSAQVRQVDSAALVVVVNDPVAFAKWHLGELRWGDALRSGAIDVQGTRTLARTLPTWHRDHQLGAQPLHRVDAALHA